MANVDFALSPIADPQNDHGSNGGLRDLLEIDVQVRGWKDSVPVDSPARPGAVRGAVEKVLFELGLPRL